jgi:ribosomal protein S18 acetylase RimI-like enzyme
MATVAARGFERMTLLVAASNARASALYDRLGFRQTAAFLAAVRRQGSG